MARMTVIGFTFIRNAVRYDYPIVEAVRSILPLCDRVVVAVGKSEDATLALVRAIHPTKIEIVRTVWDDTLREGGRVLAVETNKALAAVASDADWAFYIQGDEVLHERYHAPVRAAMQRYRTDAATDGLLFDYRHFYGSYDYVGATRRWYRREVRIIRPNRAISSYRDAQGFRRADGSKLRVRRSGGTIYHYGWVKPPETMQRKRMALDAFWHTDAEVAARAAGRASYDFSTGVDALARFEGTHPAVMHARIAARNWTFDHDVAFNRFGWKERFRRWMERHTGWYPGEYRNYRLLD